MTSLVLGDLILESLIPNVNAPLDLHRSRYKTALVGVRYLSLLLSCDLCMFGVE
jgi:hypothetical protein